MDAKLLSASGTNLIFQPSHVLLSSQTEQLLTPLHPRSLPALCLSLLCRYGHRFQLRGLCFLNEHPPSPGHLELSEAGPTYNLSAPCFLRIPNSNADGVFDIRENLIVAEKKHAISNNRISDNHSQELSSVNSVPDSLTNVFTHRTQFILTTTVIPLPQEPDIHTL